MKRQQVTRNNQQSKNETPLVRGILQRAAVLHEMDDVQAKDDHEAQGLMNSAFTQDFSQVPITATKPQQFMGLNPQRHLMPPLQAKLTIGQPGDKYEQEADRVASQVVKQINAPASAQSPQGEPIQRQEELEEEIQAKHEDTVLQRREAIEVGEASTDLASAINSARGSGQPLDAGLQQSMGQLMGADLSGVRVHTDAQSDKLNRSIQAKAFTTGQDVFFRQGAYEPESRGGQELIAHECCHVVQQNAIMTTRNREELPGGGAEWHKDNRMKSKVEMQSTPALMRKVYLDLEGKPDKKSKIYIVGVDRPATPDTTKITGVNAKNQAARHIIPDALMVRTFKARFSGKTVAELEKLIPTVPINNNYMINMAKALQDIYSYENTQLNRGEGSKVVPPGAWKDTERKMLLDPVVDSRNIGSDGPNSDKYRNFWEGDSDKNEQKDKYASGLLHTLTILSDTKFPGVTEGEDRIKDKGWLPYQKSMEKQIIGALSAEFDPPPNVEKTVLKRAGKEWSRMTNEWLQKDLVSRSYYWPGRDLTWQDAYLSKDNQTIYKNAR